MKRTKRRRRLLRIAVGAAGVGVLAFVALALALLHIPAWYRPVGVPAERLQEVRDGLADKFGEISDQMVRGRPFDVVFDHRVVSEWIVSRGEIWPDADRWIPPWLRDPLIVFTSERIILAAHLDRNGWESIVAVHFCVSVENEEVVIRLDRVTSGAVPIPLAALARPLEGLVRSERLDVEMMPDEVAAVVRKLRTVPLVEYLTEGVRYDRPLVWRNGDRPYRIIGVRLEPGRLVLRIRPL